jgi:hypothetical protein
MSESEYRQPAALAHMGKLLHRYRTHGVLERNLSVAANSLGLSPIVICATGIVWMVIYRKKRFHGLMHLIKA